MADPPESLEVTHVAIAVVLKGQEVLVGTRGLDAVLPGSAEFPGGKIEPGEFPQLAAVRECHEETGLTVVVDQLIKDVYYEYAHGPFRLHFFACHVLGETPPRPPYSWVPVDHLHTLRFPPANADVLEWLVRHAC